MYLWAKNRSWGWVQFVHTQTWVTPLFSGYIVQSPVSSSWPLVGHSSVDDMGQICQLQLVILLYMVVFLLWPPVALCSERAVQPEH